jgi:hypothetical protein
MFTHHVRSFQTEPTGFARRAVKGALVMTALIGLFFLLREHWAHAAGYWPYLLLLVCPLMHLLHRHGQHQGHGSGHVDSRER